MTGISNEGKRFGTMAALAVFALAAHESASAEADWHAVTWDNDVFVGTDNGYSAGLFYSWFDTVENNKPTVGWLAGTMEWSLSDSSKPVVTANGKTVGLTMMTPEDIELEDPPEGDLPYTGLLFYSESYLERYKGGYADRIGATIGIVGEYSFAEEAQTEIHKLIGSDEPEGWDTQTDNEIVFQFSRARIWQSWKSSSGNQDFLFSAGGALGTISSNVGAGVTWRYGRDLDRTYATMLLSDNRASNPLALENSWYWFVGLGARYTANSIFLDGNTYEDSREVEDYDRETVPFTAGFAYAWKNWSFTYAMNDLNITENEDNEDLDEYSKFGTFTIAWRAD